MSIEFDAKPEHLIEDETIAQEPTCQEIEDRNMIQLSRQLTARVYLDLNFIEPDQLDEDGTIKKEHDPYVDHSRYFALFAPNNKIIATTRKIIFDPLKGENSFPMMKSEELLSKEFHDKIKEVGIENVVEISALAKDPDLDTDNMATLLLYRTLYQTALTSGKKEKLFIMACNPALYRGFKYLFDIAMPQIGPNLDYPGQVAIPTMFDIKNGSIMVIELSNDPNNKNAKVQRDIVEFMFKGLRLSEVDDDIVIALEKNGFDNLLDEMKKNSTLAEVGSSVESKKGWHKRKPEVIAGLGLLAYTAARTVAVAKGISPYSDVDWRIFLGIELGTTPQYVYGMGDLARSLIDSTGYSKARKIKAGLLAGSALIAPYAYIAAEGNGMPDQAWVAFLAIAGLCAISPIKKLYSHIRSKNS